MIHSRAKFKKQFFRRVTFFPSFQRSFKTFYWLAGQDQRSEYSLRSSVSFRGALQSAVRSCSGMNSDTKSMMILSQIFTSCNWWFSATSFRLCSSKCDIDLLRTSIFPELFLCSLQMFFLPLSAAGSSRFACICRRWFQINPSRLCRLCCGHWFSPWRVFFFSQLKVKSFCVQSVR